MNDSIYSIKHFELYWVSNTLEGKHKFIYDFTLNNEKESNCIKIFFKRKNRFEIEKVTSCSKIQGFKYAVKKTNLQLLGHFPVGDIRIRLFYFSTDISFFQPSVFFLLKEIMPLEALLFQRTMEFKITVALLYKQGQQPHNLLLVNPFTRPIAPRIDDCPNKEGISRLNYELTDKSLNIENIEKIKDVFLVFDSYEEIDYLPDVNFFIPTKSIQPNNKINYLVYSSILQQINEKINIGNESGQNRACFIFARTRISYKNAVKAVKGMFILNSSLLIKESNNVVFYKCIKQISMLISQRKLQGYKENKYTKIMVHLIHLCILRIFMGDVYIDYKRNKFVKKKVLEITSLPLSLNKYERLLSGFNESVYRNLLSFYAYFIIDHCVNNKSNVETFVNFFFEEHHSVSYCFEKACKSVNLCFNTFKKNVKKNFFLPVNIIEYLNRYKNGTEIELFNINKVQKILSTPINLDYKEKTCEVIKHKSINMNGTNYKLSLHKQVDFKKNKTKTEEGTHLDYLMCGNYNNLNVNYNTFITNFTLIIHNMNSSHSIKNILFNFQNLEINVNTNNNLLRVLKTKQKKTENDNLVVKVNENCVVKSNKLSYKRLKFYENDVNYQCLRNYGITLYQNNCPIFEINEELLLAKNKHAIKVLEKRIIDKQYYYKIRCDALTTMCNLEFEKLGYKKELEEYRDGLVYKLLKDCFVNRADIVRRHWYDDIRVYKFHMSVLKVIYSDRYQFLHKDRFVRFLLELFKFHKTDIQFDNSKSIRVIIKCILKIRKEPYIAEVRGVMKGFVKDYILNISGFYNATLLVKVFCDYIIFLRKVNFELNKEEIISTINVLSEGTMTNDCFDVADFEYAYFKLSVLLTKKLTQLDSWFVIKTKELFFKLNASYKSKFLLKALELVEYDIKKLAYYNRNGKIAQLKEKVEKLEHKLKVMEKLLEDLEYDSKIEVAYFYRILVIIKHYFNKTTYFEWLSDFNRIIGIKSMKRIKKRIRKFWKTKDNSVTLDNIDPIHFFLN
eukprot:GAHX01002457.1.p1 GENE.GAHX01002457.1~~GAHX01002457.1.p1  ORF type:complete len:1013 (-),score=215.10 GAHX01002457.1:28-3066(-)